MFKMTVTEPSRGPKGNSCEDKQEVLRLFSESLKLLDIDRFLASNFEEAGRTPQRAIVEAILRAARFNLNDRERREVAGAWLSYVGLSAQNIRHLEICSIVEFGALLRISHTELRSLADRGRFDAEVKQKLLQSTMLLQNFFRQDPKKRLSLEDSPSTSNQSTPASSSNPSTSSVPSLTVSRFPASASMNFAPKSPSASARLVHNIPHKWHRSNKFRFRGGDSVCHFCQRPLGFGFLNAWEKCRSCRAKVHTQCKSRVGDSCGLTPDHLRFLFDKLIQENNGGMWNDPQSAMPLPGSRSMNEPAFQYPDNPIDSSSSTNSSAPSTPAYPLGASSSAGNSLNPLTASIRDRKFFFGESEPLFIPVSAKFEELKAKARSERETQYDPKNDPANESEGTLVAETTESNDNNCSEQQDKVGNMTERGHQWDRNTWNMSTIRGPNTQASWNDVTVHSKDISFGQLIGRGRFGNVVIGFHFGDVAVKLLTMDHVPDFRRAEEFKLEVSAYKNTRHDNISLFLGYFMFDEKYGIVTSLLKVKQSLYSIIHVAKDKLDLAACRRFAQQICQGVSYLHTKKILHKDLRTKNILLELNKVVITDFGLMSMRRLCYPKANYGYIMPKYWLSYAAPELVTSLRCEFDEIYGDDLPFSESSDVYAFGTLWFEMLCGQMPFSKEEPHQILYMKSMGMSTLLPSLVCTKEMKDLLTRCWNTDASDRPSFSDIVAKLVSLPTKRGNNSTFPALKSYESNF